MMSRPNMIARWISIRVRFALDRHGSATVRAILTVTDFDDSLDRHGQSELAIRINSSVSLAMRIF